MRSATINLEQETNEELQDQRQIFEYLQAQFPFLVKTYLLFIEYILKALLLFLQSLLLFIEIKDYPSSEFNKKIWTGMASGILCICLGLWLIFKRVCLRQNCFKRMNSLYFSQYLFSSALLLAQFLSVEAISNGVSKISLTFLLSIIIIERQTEKQIIPACFQVVSIIYAFLRSPHILEIPLEQLALGFLICCVLIFKNYIEGTQQLNQLAALNIVRHQLNLVRQFYNDLLGLIPQGLTLLDNQQNIIYANSRVTEILQCDEQDIFQILMNLSNNNSKEKQNNEFDPARNLAVSIASAFGKAVDSSTINSRNNVQSVSSNKNGAGQALINCLNLNNFTMEKTFTSGAGSGINLRTSNVQLFPQQRSQQAEQVSYLAKQTLGSSDSFQTFKHYKCSTSLKNNTNKNNQINQFNQQQLFFSSDQNIPLNKQKPYIPFNSFSDQLDLPSSQAEDSQSAKNENYTVGIKQTVLQKKESQESAYFATLSSQQIRAKQPSQYSKREQSLSLSLQSPTFNLQNKNQTNQQSFLKEQIMELNYGLSESSSQKLIIQKIGEEELQNKSVQEIQRGLIYSDKHNTLNSVPAHTYIVTERNEMVSYVSEKVEDNSAHDNRSEIELNQALISQNSKQKITTQKNESSNKSYNSKSGVSISKTSKSELQSKQSFVSCEASLSVILKNQTNIHQQKNENSEISSASQSQCTRSRKISIPLSLMSLQNNHLGTYSLECPQKLSLTDNIQLNIPRTASISKSFSGDDHSVKNDVVTFQNIQNQAHPSSFSHSRKEITENPKNMKKSLEEGSIILSNFQKKKEEEIESKQKILTSQEVPKNQEEIQTNIFNASYRNPNQLDPNETKLGENDTSALMKKEEFFDDSLSEGRKSIILDKSGHNKRSSRLEKMFKTFDVQNEQNLGRDSSNQYQKTSFTTINKNKNSPQEPGKQMKTSLKKNSRISQDIQALMVSPSSQKIKQENFVKGNDSAICQQKSNTQQTSYPLDSILKSDLHHSQIEPESVSLKKCVINQQGGKETSSYKSLFQPKIIKKETKVRSILSKLFTINKQPSITKQEQESVTNSIKQQTQKKQREDDLEQFTRRSSSISKNNVNISPQNVSKTYQNLHSPINHSQTGFNLKKENEEKNIKNCKSIYSLKISAEPVPYRVHNFSDPENNNFQNNTNSKKNKESIINNSMSIECQEQENKKQSSANLSSVLRNNFEKQKSNTVQYCKDHLQINNEMRQKLYSQQIQQKTFENNNETLNDSNTILSQNRQRKESFFNQFNKEANIGRFFSLQIQFNFIL